MAGGHGKPSYGAFNVEHLNLCRQDVIEYQKCLITGEVLRGCETEEASHDWLETLLSLMPQTGVFWIGGDLGYTNDPTETVTYPHIAQTIGLLDRYYAATGIGVDNGGNGLAVVQELLTLDKYRDLQLDGRLRGYDFGGMTTLAVRDGKQVRKHTKEFMTSLINGALQRRQVVFPVEDLEIKDRFTTHTYTLHGRPGDLRQVQRPHHRRRAVRDAGEGASQPRSGR